MTRTLVAYYSLSGTTARVAQAVAARLSADLEPINDARRRTAFFGVIRGLYEVGAKKSPAIAPAAHNVADYDLVILGCPVWASHMASPMRAYIERERARFKRLALFCTVGAMAARRRCKRWRT